MKELFSSALFSLESFAHAIGYGAFIEGLVGLNGHFNLISDSDEKESSFGALNSDLTDQLIEALGVQFFTNRADSGFPGLSALDVLVQFILQIDNVDLGSGSGRDVTHPQLALFGVLTRWQD